MKQLIEQPGMDNSILFEEEFIEFLEDRSIEKKDHAIIIELSHFSKDIFIELLHNFFSYHKEKSSAELANLLNKNEINENEKKFLKLVFEFTKKYNWSVAENLVYLFENKINKKGSSPK
jgi:hypothetical protein